MSLKRRNRFAWLLIVLSASLWVYSRSLRTLSGEAVTETTVAGTIEEIQETAVSGYAYEETIAGASPEESSRVFSEESSQVSPETPAPETESPSEALLRREEAPSRLAGVLACIASLLLAAAAVFLLYAKSPLLGPDLAGILAGVFLLLYQDGSFSPAAAFVSILSVILLLLSLRELFGWLLSRFPLNWSLCHRIAAAGRGPGQYLLLVFIWTLASCAVSFFLLPGLLPADRSLFLAESSSAFFLLPTRFPSGRLLLFVGMLTAAGFGVGCLLRCVRDLSHFEEQLGHFKEGQPIAVREGAAFAGTERQLMEIQERHREAVHTAVTSERFKVELISNVSHDLRTPLSAILGYGELLQKESLSPAGAKQLSYLNQKAGYMRDLVDNLFELTRVSSGVITAKREEIDLIRLLEQTVGLFDDSLTSAGFSVRRHYKMDTAPIVTDGGRMHQVFANLLGNAVKYALPGTRIYLEAEEYPDSYSVRMVNTASYEMDFEPEEILQRFARGDKARSTAGSGLGLAIAKTYTESVGGRFLVTVDGDQFNAVVTLPKGGAQNLI